MAPVMCNLAGPGQAAFADGLADVLGFRSVPLGDLPAELRAGRRVLVHGWAHDYEVMARDFPGLLAVAWHSGWSGSDILGEGKTLTWALREARARRIDLLWVETRDVLPPGATAIWPVWSRERITAMVGDQPPARRPGHVIVGLHGWRSGPAKNALACLAAAAHAGVTIHLSASLLEDSPGIANRAPIVKELLSWAPHEAHPQMAREQAVRLVASAEVLVHASLSETWPYLAMEAAYVGTPAILSPTVPWSRALPEDIRRACVAEPKASGQIQEVLVRLLESDLLRRRVADAQRATLDEIAPIHARRSAAALRGLGFEVPWI